MAKLGEGDPRWIVKDRSDGTNVNNWHWTEKDALEWSRQRLAELFKDVKIVDGPYQGLELVTVTTTGVKAVEGEAFLNNRKNKLVASYELNIQVSWQGSSSLGEGSGVIQIPYLAEENHDEDPEIRVVTDKDDKASQVLKQAILSDGKQVIINIINTFLEELTTGGPLKEPSATSAAATTSTSTPAAANGGTNSSAATAAANGSAKAQPACSSGKRHSLQLTERFYARPVDIFECFVQEGRLRAFTMSPATVEPQVGGKFSWFDGSITGEFVELEPPKRIVMKWRFSHWEDGCFSKVTIELSEPEPGTTVLDLQQTDIPAADKFGNQDVIDTVEKGWAEQVFRRIKTVFGSVPLHNADCKFAGCLVRLSVCLLRLATHICSCQRTTGTGAMHPYTSLTLLLNLLLTWEQYDY
eukprot:jgi/Chrzof1/7830/Cz02g38040.t1